MRTARLAVVILVSLLVGIGLGSTLLPARAEGPDSLVGRYTLFEGGASVHLVDTASGRVWYRSPMGPEKDGRMTWVRVIYLPDGEKTVVLRPDPWDGKVSVTPPH